MDFSEIPRPDSLEYYRQLQLAHDQAFEESHLVGRRRQIGIFTVGSVSALWETEDGGSAYLYEAGLQINGQPVFKTYSSLLSVIEGDGGTDEDIETTGGVGLTEYDIDFAYGGMIRVRKTIATGTFRDYARFRLSQRREKQHELHFLEDEDYEKLLLEMRRGATGLYSRT